MPTIAKPQLIDQVLTAAIEYTADSTPITRDGDHLVIVDGAFGSYRVPLTLFESGFDQWAEQTRLYPEDQEPETIASAAAARAGQWDRVEVNDETLLTATVELTIGSTLPQHALEAA